MSAYLDASLVVSLFLIDANSVRARALLGAEPAPVLSDWCAVEVSGVIARQMRIGALSSQDTQTAYRNFDRWRVTVAREDTMAADVDATMRLVRRADLNLRGPDALHLVIASRLGAKLLTFDARLAAAAKAVGVKLVR